MNCMNCSNADSKTIASNVNLSWRNSKIRLKSLHNDEKYVVNIIDLLIQTSMLEKEKNKDHSWKEVAVKLMHHLQLESEEKHHVTQNAFITKNVQKLKTSVQLLSKQLQMQRNTRSSLKIMSWANVTKEELSMKKQRFREESSSLHKKHEVMIKIADREEIKKMQKKIIKQILQKIADVSMNQQDLIMFFLQTE